MDRAKKHIKSFDQMRNEIIQCYLRIGFIAIGLLALFITELLGNPIRNQHVYVFLIGYSLWVVFNFGLIKLRPHLFPRSRIFVIMLTDIFATGYALYLAGSLSAIFVPAFLWYIIGYGMRFGPSFALTASVATAITWIILFFVSPYWNFHPYHFMGWLFAFFIIPLYYFILVKRLHTSLRELSIALDKTEKIAARDPLTKLANRAHFNRLAERLFEKNKKLALLLMDLDGFKSVNDQYGHNVGDELLSNVGRMLKRCCPSEDIVARLGGDEFIIATTRCSHAELDSLSRKILEDVASVTAGYGCVTASIGICCCPENAQDLSHAKSIADTAMYAAKKNGKNQHLFYSELLPPQM